MSAIGCRRAVMGVTVSILTIGCGIREAAEEIGVERLLVGMMNFLCD